MIVRTMSQQEYEKNHISPSGLVFFKNEKELCEILSMHCAQNILENIHILDKVSNIKIEDVEVLEITNSKLTLYVIKNDTTTTAIGHKGKVPVLKMAHK